MVVESWWWRRWWLHERHHNDNHEYEADTDETFTDLVKRSYKPKVKTMSKEAQGLLPTLTVSNRVGEMAITGEAELVVKDPSTYGFSWCKTEQLTGTVMHQYQLHAFPFDVHEVALRLPRSLALSHALSRSPTLSRALPRSLTLSHALSRSLTAC